MDTDELSQEAYQAILIEAELFNHDLTLRFGVLSGDCKDEEEYLDKSLRLVGQIKKAKKHQLENFFFDEVPDIDQLNKTLERIQVNIAKVNEIPFDKRHFDF